jgi:alanine dehydrogenase
MLFIHNDVVDQVLTMEDAIGCLERAFRQLVEGTATHRPRCDMYAPSKTVDDGYYRWGTMEGYNDGIFAIRMKSDVMTWPQTRTATGPRKNTASSRAPGAALSCSSAPITANRWR